MTLVPRSNHAATPATPPKGLVSSSPTEAGDGSTEPRSTARPSAADGFLQQQHQQSDDTAARQSIVWQNMAQAMVAGGHNVEAMTVFRERLAGLPAVTAAMWCTFAQAAFQQALFVDSYQAFERTLALLGATFVLICVR